MIGTFLVKNNVARAFAATCLCTKAMVYEDGTLSKDNGSELGIQNEENDKLEFSCNVDSHVMG